jgi:hypothetical protein
VGGLHSQPPMGVYRDFDEIPGMTDRTSGLFQPWNQGWTRVPHDILINYGKEQPTDDDRVAGDGDHVGTILQAANRFIVLFNWAAALWPSLPKAPAPRGGLDLTDRQIPRWFQSATLGAKRSYGVVLPPGYDAKENAETRYPVLFLMHGYGQSHLNLFDLALISDAYMTDSDVKLRPMILVTIDGRCCFSNKKTGALDCREEDDRGVSFSSQPDWERECAKGNFFIDSTGYRGGDGRAYAESVFELIDEIDKTYRTLPPADVEAR